MAKSRTDKSRKEKVVKYKNSKNKIKEMAKLPETKPFRQVPTWDSNETFEINGAQLEAIYNFTNLFAPLFGTVQQVFGDGVKSGKIKVGYEYEDGTPVPADEVADYTTKLQNYFKELQAEKDAEAAKSEASDLAPTSKIVSFTGEPVSSVE